MGFKEGSPLGGRVLNKSGERQMQFEVRMAEVQEIEE